GFVVAEFAVTPAAAFTLLDRGMPFLVTMVDAGYSHTQLAAGADRTRHSLWLSDAVERRTTEAPLTLLTERYAATGPRGLALVPAAEAGRLSNLHLPDRALYDRLQEAPAAPHHPDRPAAGGAHRPMKAPPTRRPRTRLGR